MAPFVIPGFEYVEIEEGWVERVQRFMTLHQSQYIACLLSPQESSLFNVADSALLADVEARKLAPLRDITWQTAPRVI